MNSINKMLNKNLLLDKTESIFFMTFHTILHKFSNTRISKKFDSRIIAFKGDLIKVCVKPNPGAEAQGVKMDKIDSFDWIGAAVTQNAISDGLKDSDGLTDYVTTASCSPSICTFSSILKADFYQTGGTASGSGVAKLKFNRRLGVKADANNRVLQEESIEMKVTQI